MTADLREIDLNRLVRTVSSLRVIYMGIADISLSACRGAPLPGQTRVATCAVCRRSQRRVRRTTSAIKISMSSNRHSRRHLVRSAARPTTAPRHRYCARSPSLPSRAGRPLRVRNARRGLDLPGPVFIRIGAVSGPGKLSTAEKGFLSKPATCRGLGLTRSAAGSGLQAFARRVPGTQGLSVRFINMPPASLRQVVFLMGRQGTPRIVTSVVHECAALSAVARESSSSAGWLRRTARHPDQDVFVGGSEDLFTLQIDAVGSVGR